MKGSTKTSVSNKLIKKNEVKIEAINDSKPIDIKVENQDENVNKKNKELDNYNNLKNNTYKDKNIEILRNSQNNNDEVKEEQKKIGNNKNETKFAVGKKNKKRRKTKSLMLARLKNSLDNKNNDKNNDIFNPIDDIKDPFNNLKKESIENNKKQTEEDIKKTIQKVCKDQSDEEDLKDNKEEEDIEEEDEEYNSKKGSIKLGKIIAKMDKTKKNIETEEEDIEEDNEGDIREKIKEDIDEKSTKDNLEDNQNSNKDNLEDNQNDEISFDNDTNKNEELEKSNQNELRKNLKPKEKLQNYFIKMFNYYRIKSSEQKYYYLYFLSISKYYSLEKAFKFKINYDQLPFVSNMFNFLMEQLKPAKDTNNEFVYKEYEGKESFGYLKLYKQYELNNYLDVNSSVSSIKSGGKTFDKIDSHFLESENFESNINKFFKNYNLKELPNYFFELVNLKPIDFNKKEKSKEEETKIAINNEIIKKNSGKMNMLYIDQNYFSSYIEIDGAFAYLEESPLTIISENNKMFKVSKSISVSLPDKEIKINDEDKNDFVINKNTILLIEDKLSFPNVIKDLTQYMLIEKEKLYKSLNLLIYKTIKKINIFAEYLRTISEGKNKDYSYYLLLIYDSYPVGEVEDIIKNILFDLKGGDLIKYPNFKIKVIYVLPCISLNESDKVEKLEKELKSLKEKTDKELAELRQKILSLEKKNK